MVGLALNLNKGGQRAPSTPFQTQRENQDNYHYCNDESGVILLRIIILRFFDRGVGSFLKVGVQNLKLLYSYTALAMGFK